MDRMKHRMTVRIVSLESDEAGDARMGGTVEARVAAVAQLTLEAWRLADRPIPSYTRTTMPIARRTLRDPSPRE